MALIGEPASQGDLGDAQVPARQQNLRSGNPELPYVSADGTSEMMVELAAHLHRMASGTARQILKRKIARSMFLQHLSNAQKPGRNLGAAERLWPSVGQKELQRQPFQGHSGNVVPLTELAMKLCAKNGSPG
jgi:hypothetical protein